MTTILHITDQYQWEQAQKKGYYTTESLGREGFIPCLTPQQLIPATNKLFPTQHKFLLLCILPGQVKAEVLYEGEPEEGYCPRLYGILNLDAVFMVVNLVAQEDGTLALSSELKALVG